MRSRITLALLTAALAAAPALAQQPHFGIGLNLAIPTGSFSSTTYPPNDVVFVPQTEGYDPGLGLQFTVSLPLDPHVALRLGLSGQSVSGTNTAQGYETIHLRHQLFSLSGEVQIFPGRGSAYQHKGTYLVGGLSADFERFERSYNDNFDTYDEYGNYIGDNVDTERKSRMGLLMGVGHSFGYGGGGRFTMELAYHKTLTGHDSAKFEPVPADFLRLGFGWVF